MSKIVLVAALAAASACASAPRASAPQLTGTVPMQLTVRGSGYVGSATLTDGLSGTFTVAGPVEVKGTLTGAARGDSVTIDATYSIAANNCRGTMKLLGAYAAGRRSAQGTVDATDSCVGKMTGTFRIGQ